MSGTSSREVLSSSIANFAIVTSLVMLDLELVLPMIMLFGLWQLVFQRPSNSNQFGINTLLQKSLMLLPFFSKSLAASQASYFEKYSWGAKVSINAMLTLPTGGHVIAGSIIANDKDQPLLAQFSALGETLWAFRFNNSGAFYSLLDSSEGKFLVGGKLTIPQLRDYWTNGILLEMNSAQPSIVRAAVISDPPETYDHDKSIPISNIIRDSQQNLIVAGGKIDNDGPVRTTKLSPDWKILNAVEYNAPNGESVINLAISNQTLYLIAHSNNPRKSYLVKLDPTLAQLQILHNDGDIKYFSPYPGGGAVALIQTTAPLTKFIVFYGNDNKILWHYDLGGYDYFNPGNKILFDPKTNDILLLVDGNSQLLIFSNTGQFKNFIKIADNTTFSPRDMNYASDGTLTVVGSYNCTRCESDVEDSYLLQILPPGLIDNCTRVISSPATFKNATNTTLLQLTDVTTSSPFNRIEITPQIVNVLNLVKDLLVPIDVGHDTLCAGNKATFFASTMTGSMQTTSIPQDANNTSPHINITAARQPTSSPVNNTSGIASTAPSAVKPESANSALLGTSVLAGFGGLGFIAGIILLGLYIRRKPHADSSPQTGHNIMKGGAVIPANEYGSVNRAGSIYEEPQSPFGVSVKGASHS